METPKEKAKELVEKHMPYTRDWDIEKYALLNAKECALITVNEILDLGYVPNEKSTFNVYKFYSVVKLEIELL